MPAITTYTLLITLLSILRLSHADISFTAPSTSQPLNISDGAPPIRIAWTLSTPQSTVPSTFPNQTMQLWITGDTAEGSSRFAWAISQALPLPETLEYEWDHAEFLKADTNVTASGWVLQARWTAGTNGSDPANGHPFESQEYEMVGSENIVESSQKGAAVRMFGGVNAWAAVLVGLVSASGIGML